MKNAKTFRDFYKCTHCNISIAAVHRSWHQGIWWQKHGQYFCFVLLCLHHPQAYFLVQMPYTEFLTFLTRFFYDNTVITWYSLCQFNLSLITCTTFQILTYLIHLQIDSKNMLRTMTLNHWYFKERAVAQVWIPGDHHILLHCYLM